MRRDIRDLAAGGFFALAGLGFMIGAWNTLSIGSAARMGPGYFPLLLGSVLALLGLAIIVRGLRGSMSEPFEGLAWRGMAMIGAAPLIFAWTVTPLGLVPSLFISTLTAALSSPEVGAVKAALVSAVIVIFCILVFSVGLGLPIPLIGPWLGGGA